MHCFFSFQGHIGRRQFWLCSLGLWAIFAVLLALIEPSLGRNYTWAVYPFFFWSLCAIISKRYHDRNKSGFWGLLVLIPILGPLAMFLELGFMKGKSHA